MKKSFIALLLAVSMCVLCAVASSETVISLSYLKNTIRPELSESLLKQNKEIIGAPDGIQERGETAIAAISKDGVISDAANRVLESLQMKGYYLYSTNGAEKLTLKKDDVISGLCGTTVLLSSGSASVINNKIINISQGIEAKAGSAVSKNNNYMIPESNGAGIRITSETAEVIVDGVYRVVSLRYRARYFDIADALNKMDLFRGSNVGYELSRGATRAEALVMLLRLLGEEDEALAYTGAHPFTDVDVWVDRYVAYAYSKGYTNGISHTKFGTKNMTTASHYMTFLLRALGYNDANGDFKWDKSLDFAVSCAIITQNEKTSIEKIGFHRDQMVYLSYYSLFAKIKAGDERLLDRLIEDGTVSKKAADIAVQSVERPRL